VVTAWVGIGFLILRYHFLLSFFSFLLLLVSNFDSNSLLFFSFLKTRYIHNKQEAAKQAAELQMKREIERKESLAKIEKKESLAKIEKKGKKGDKAGLLASSDDLHEEDEEIEMQNRKN